MTRVLLVDDEPELREAWSFALLHAGYEVRCARNGREALEMLSDGLPDLLITDLMMPVMDGKALCREIRAREAWQGLPVLLHSAALVNEADNVPLLWNVYLRKPAPLHRFLETVKRLTGCAH